MPRKQSCQADTRELECIFWHQCRKHRSLRTESNRKNWKIMCHFLLTSLLSGAFNHWIKQAGLGLENTKEIHLPRVSTAFQTLSQTAGWRRNWEHSQDGRKTRVNPNASAISFPLNQKIVITILHNLQKRRILSWTDRLDQEHGTETTALKLESSG